MQITLNKANKLLGKFKQARYDLRALFNRGRYSDENEKVEAITNIEVSLANLTPRINQEIQRVIDIYNGQLRDCLNITEDYFSLKEAVFSANQQTGVSLRLSRIEFFNEKISLYDELIDENKRHKRVTLGLEEIDYQLLSQNLAHQEGKGELSIRVFELEQLERDRQEAINNVAQLEDEIFILNNQTMIEIEFSQAGKNIAGLGTSSGLPS